VGAQDRFWPLAKLIKFACFLLDGLVAILTPRDSLQTPGAFFIWGCQALDKGISEFL